MHDQCTGELIIALQAVRNQATCHFWYSKALGIGSSKFDLQFSIYKNKLDINHSPSLFSILDNRTFYYVSLREQIICYSIHCYRYSNLPRQSEWDGCTHKSGLTHLNPVYSKDSSVYTLSIANITCTTLAC